MQQKQRMDWHINYPVRAMIQQVATALETGVAPSIIMLDWLDRVVEDAELWTETRTAAERVSQQFRAYLDTMLNERPPNHS